MRIGIAFPDAVGGLHGAFALLAALWERELPGDGACTSTCRSSRRCCRSPASRSSSPARRARAGRATATAPPTTPRRASTAATATTRGSPSRCRATPSGGAGGLLGDDALVDLAGADLAARAAAHDEIDAALGRWTAIALRRSRPPRSCRRSASPPARRSPTATSCSTTTSRARGFIVEWDHPDVGGSAIPGSPIHFRSHRRASCARRRRSAPHNVDVLRGVGYDDDQIDALEARGVIADQPPPP